VSAIQTVIRKIRLVPHQKNKNVWGDGRASQRIVEILQTTPFDSRLLNKQINY